MSSINTSVLLYKKSKITLSPNIIEKKKNAMCFEKLKINPNSMKKKVKASSIIRCSFETKIKVESYF